MKISYVKKLWADFNAQYFDSLLPEITIRITRGTKCHGSFVYHESSGSSVLKVSAAINKSPEILRDTLLHEMCHQFLYVTTGDSDSEHGERFLLVANKIGIQTCPSH